MSKINVLHTKNLPTKMPFWETVIFLHIFHSHPVHGFDLGQVRVCVFFLLLFIVVGLWLKYILSIVYEKSTDVDLKLLHKMFPAEPPTEADYLPKKDPDRCY